MSLTAKQENFCINIVKGMTQYDAYMNSYDVDPNSKRGWVDNEATEHMKNPEITHRIEELREPIVKKIKEELEYTALESFKEFERLKGIALRNDNVQGALKAEENRGKLAGLYVEKKEILTKQEDISSERAEELLKKFK